MLINADLHIHSRFSGATSPSMTVEVIAREAARKGINVVGTGDCLHRKWLKEILSKCKEIDEGTFLLGKTRFIPTVEIEDKNRVHHLLMFPSLSSIENFRESIYKYSKNIDIDGRPKVSLSGEEIAELAKDNEALIGPAHAFTPWTALYAYHNSLTSCYGSMTSYVSFLELGLSADSNYADKISELHRVTFLTNSDAHSPYPVRLAREFNRMEVEDATYEYIRKSILRKKGNKIVLNIGLPPQEGKYNETACVSCYRHYTLEEATKRNWRCICGGRIKKGVKDRVNELADLEYPVHPSYRPPYVHIIPLAEIIAKALGQSSSFTKTVSNRWKELINVFENEVNILIDVDIDKISKVTIPAISDTIRVFREGKIVVRPGGGGRYGAIEIESPISSNNNLSKQKTLLDY